METTSAEIELNRRNAAANIIEKNIKKQPKVKNMFKDRHIAKRMAIRKTDIKDLLKNLFIGPNSFC